MKRFFVTVLLAMYAVMAFAQTSIKVQTHNVVAADEQFNVTFIIEGEAKSSDFSWEPGDDFQLLWGPQQGRSTSVQMINGKTTKSVQTTYSYVLRPVKAGKFTIARASAKVKGNDYRSIDIGIVAAYITAEAQAQGLGSCILGWLDDQKLRKICGVEHPVRLVITLGYAKDALRTKKRKEIAELVTEL